MEKLFIDNEDIKLEAEYYESNTDKKSGIVICHPHPQIN
jgi:alpha/beta superfamily hydrolase